MAKISRTISMLILIILTAAVLTTGCGRNTPAVTDTAAPTVVIDLPKIMGVELDRAELPRYESLEMKLAVEAKYSNPYDGREVRLDGVFTAPDGIEMKVPGFWDGEEAWWVRFTPSQEGEWSYQLTMHDTRGDSLPAEGKFTVTPSDLHGWLQVGNWVNPEYSSHYRAYQDGTPFYGVGHCDALNILNGGYKADTGVPIFNQMMEAGENYVVWWPLYSNSPVSTSYKDYSVANLKIIDLVVKDAQVKNLFLIFTIWDHPELRAPSHAWGNGNWGRNGFSQLGDIDSFFTSDEAWAWQENLYRYIIARWGYSPAIGMWQTVSEINGTNAYDQTDAWHAKVNAYFVENDPYRHPTTASMSGDTDWPAGHQVMDAPQVHIYALDKDAVKAAEIIASWTSRMWERGKPNWVGEFGVEGNNYYPEMFHNSIWAALGAGAAMTPAEWNSGGSWGEMTAEMNADMGRLAAFVADIPLAKLNPSPLQISSSDPQVRAWGVAGKEGGLFWVQDFSMEGKSIEEVRQAKTPRQGVQVEIQGMAGGTYIIASYDTWRGTFLETLIAYEVSCTEGQACTIALPEFTADMAFKITRK
jgi:hypothetical protein